MVQKMISQGRKLAEKWKWTKKQEQKKNYRSGCKTWIECKLSYGRNSWQLGFYTAVIRGTVNMDTDKLHEDQLIDLNEESSCKEKDKDIPVEVIPVKTHIKDNLGNIIQHWNTHKKSLLEADPNLEKVW